MNVLKPKESLLTGMHLITAEGEVRVVMLDYMGSGKDMTLKFDQTSHIVTHMKNNEPSRMYDQFNLKHWNDDLTCNVFQDRNPEMHKNWRRLDIVEIRGEHGDVLWTREQYEQALVDKYFEDMAKELSLYTLDNWVALTAYIQTSGVFGLKL